MKPKSNFLAGEALLQGKLSTNYLIKGSLALLFFVAFSSFEAKAQVPVAYYDFEDNARTTFENNADVNLVISGVSPSAITKGGSGTISGIAGAGKANGGNSAVDGMAITSTGWSTGNSMANPATYYYQFSVNTTGLEDLFLSVDIKRGNQGPAKCGLQYSIDGGTTFVNQTWTIGNDKNINANFDNAKADFSTVPDLDNKSVVYFRIVGYSAGDINGELMIDNLTISAKTFTRSATLLSESAIYAGINGGLTGGTITRDGLSVTGTGTVVTMTSDIAIATNKDVTVGTGSTLDFGTAVNKLTGAGRFTLSPGATLKINSPQGISNTAGQGNIQLTGTKTYDGGANYIYQPNTAGMLVTGNALPTTISGNLQLNPGASTTGPIEFTNTSTTLTGTYNLVDGAAIINTGKTLAIGSGGHLTFGANTADALTGTGNFALNAGATIDISSVDGISTLAGKGNIQVTGTRTFNAGANYNYVVNTPGTLTTGNALPATLSGNLNVTLGPLTDSPLTLSQNTTLNGSLTATSGEIAVGTGNTLTVNSGLSLNGGSLSVGAGSLVLNGPAISGSTAQTGLLTTSSSNLTMAGSSSNIIIPASVTSVRDLAINNANGINVNAILEVNRQLTLTSGKVYTTAAKKIKIRANATLVGGSTTSFIDGPLTFENSGTTAVTRVFPIGKGSNYRPVTLTVTQDAATATEYTAEQKEGSHPQITIPEAELQNVSGIRYFSINKGAGANITSGKITLTYGADDDVTDPLNLRIAKTNSDYSGWINIGRDAATSSSATTGTITSSINFDYFSDFLIANAKGGSNPLPVELASFNAEKQGINVVLNWSTASEKDNKGFEVQVSQDNQEFRSLGFVASKNGNSQTVQTYNFTDTESGKSGIRYYRLKQQDLDGSITYSAIKAVTFGKAMAQASVYPNPFYNEISVQLPASINGQGTIEMTDAIGNLIYTLPVALKPEASQVKVNVPESVSAGVYVLAVKTTEGTSYHKIMKH